MCLSNLYCFDRAHYGVDFFIEVVDAVTDRPVGTTVLTTQGLLQQQRDLMLESGQVAIFKVGKSPPTFKGKQRMVLELRTGIKSGVSSDFFVSADSKTQQGMCVMYASLESLHSNVLNRKLLCNWFLQAKSVGGLKSMLVLRRTSNAYMVLLLMNAPLGHRIL